MSEEEKELQIAELSGLKKEMNPSAELEERIVSQLMKRGMIRRKSIFSIRNGAIATAAAIVIFALGFATAEFFRRTPTQYTYLLLLREDSHFLGSRDHAPSLVKEYSEWALGIAQSGTKITGEKLTAETRLVNAKSGIQNKMQDPDGQIAGFFLLEAMNDRDAVEKAFHCPHLRYGGSIELRRIDR
jgi:hypothetical protein